MARLYVEPPILASVGLLKVPWEKLRKYEMTDFDITKTISSGTYGETHLGTIKVTTDEVVIKFYSKYTGFLKKDMCKELLFLNYLNQFPETKTVKLYGYIYEDTVPPKFGLVLEKLEKTINDFTIKKYNVDSAYRGRLKPKEYKLLFYKMLKGMANIHGLGIVHNDIKLENIMISKTDIRYIDFGLSDYLGISPFSPNINNYITTELFKAPDKSDTISEKYIDGNRKSYGSDIYSLGVTFLDMILKNYSVYRWSADNIFSMNYRDTTKQQEIKDFIIQRLSLDPIDSSDNLLNEEGINGYDLIHKMINPNSRERISAKEALLLPYFHDISIIESTITMDRVLRLGGDPEIFKRMPQRIISEDTYARKKFEIAYLEDIFQNTKNDKIPILQSFNFKFLHMANYILFLLLTNYFDGETSYTALLSMLNYCRNLPNKDPYTQFEIANIYTFFNNVFNYKAISTMERFELFNNSTPITDFSKLTTFVLENMNNPFITIVNQLDYFNLKLMYEFSDPRLQPIIDKIYGKIMIYLFFICLSPTDLNLTNWEIISVLSTYIINKLTSIPISELLERPIIPGLELSDYDRKIELILRNILVIKNEIDKMKDDRKINLLPFVSELFPFDTIEPTPIPVIAPVSTAITEEPKPGGKRKL